VDPEGHIAYLQNFYSVPWQRIGELLPVRVTENELIVYGPDVKEIARHELYPAGIIGKKRSLPAHSPGRDHLQKRELLRQRFAEFGLEGVRFFDELLRARRNGKDEAARVLGLLTVYRREDLVRALERAGRYRAFSWSAVERILAAQAKPRSAMEALTIEAREQLDEMLRQIPLAPRSTAEYQTLLEDTAKDAPKRRKRQKASPHKSVTIHIRLTAAENGHRVTRNWPLSHCQNGFPTATVRTVILRAARERDKGAPETAELDGAALSVSPISARTFNAHPGWIRPEAMKGMPRACTSPSSTT
jgi:hypothetical protein